MFLPVLLLDRWGWPGFLAFAIPNVIGCAAFGYVLRKRAAADHALRHVRAMRTFSLVTIGYHVFFIGFVCWLLLPIEREDAVWVATAAPPAMFAAAWILSELPTRLWPSFASVVYAFSLIAFVRLGAQPLAELPLEGPGGGMLPAAMLWLSPVFLFGFLLCPYLDLTFHRALKEAPSRHAFAVFGIAFSVMIVLTCAYWDVLQTGLLWIVFGHIAAQSVFTVGAHLAEVRATMPTNRGGRSRLMLLAPLLAMPLVFVGAFASEPLGASIDAYVRFLVFYGLVFPGYVLLFIGPWPLPRTGRYLVSYAAAVMLLLPLYELGFLHGQEWMLTAGPLLLVSWAVIHLFHGRRSRSTLPPESTTPTR
jgi:hypothetical protein